MIYGVLCQCQAHHGECHENVYYPKQTLSPEDRFCRDCLFLDAINVLTRVPSPECDARIKVRLCLLVWCDLRSEVLRVVRHTVGPLFLHCRYITEQPTAVTIWLLHRWREAEPLPFYFHCLRLCTVVSFRENASVAILAADSKRSFWAAWTVMNNCRSQFGWQSALLKESAIRRVVERQV